MPVIFSNAACPKSHTAKNNAGPSTTPPGAKYQPNQASDKATSHIWDAAIAGAGTEATSATELMALETTTPRDRIRFRCDFAFGTEASGSRATTTRRARARRVPRVTTRGTCRVVDAKADISQRNHQSVECSVMNAPRLGFFEKRASDFSLLFSVALQSRRKRSFPSLSRAPWRHRIHSFACSEATKMPRITRMSFQNTTARLAVAVLVFAACALRCGAVVSEPEAGLAKKVVPSNPNALPIRLPPDPKCPWLADGVVGAARASPLVAAIVARTRAAAPFGPGSWPDRFTLSEANAEEGPKYGWSKAAIFSLTVPVDQASAQSWLPDALLTVTPDSTARVFVAWYPDSFCCGPYHEIGIVLNVTHVKSGITAAHCPWMLVDSDRSMIAGREVLGFPKKLGTFSFTVNGKEVRELSTTELVDALTASETVAEIKATVERGGTTLFNASGTLSGKAPVGTTAFGGVANETLAFLNVQTNHPIPPNADGTNDPACLGNRPRLVQFTFDEVPVVGNAWAVADTVLVLNGTKTDKITTPFTSTLPSSNGSASTQNSVQSRVDVLTASFVVTNFYTGTEQTPAMGESVPQGYVEDDDIYWLRYQ